MANTSSILQDSFGVSMSGDHWDIDGYRLWSSTNPETILYCTTQPSLAKNSATGRRQASLTIFRKWQNGEYAISGGSALLSIDASGGLEGRELTKAMNQWRYVLENRGYASASKAMFERLTIRNARFQVLIDQQYGRLNPGSMVDQVDDLSGSHSVLVELTAKGAAEWFRAITSGGTVAGTIKVSYEYPRLMPDVDAYVAVKGTRVYLHLSQVLHKSTDVIYGNDTEIKSAWDKLFAEGAIAITMNGLLQPDLQSKRQELLDTFAGQAREQLFAQLFEPMPVTPSATAANGTTPTPANYALKWRKTSDAIDFNFTLKFEAWNWLEESMATDIGVLIKGLDESYVSTVFAEVSVPVSVVVEPHSQVAGVSVALTFSEGHPVESAVFGSAGGTEQYVVSSSRPDKLKVSYNAGISFVQPQWPVLETSGTATVAGNGAQILIQPGTWIQRQTIYLYVRDGDRIKRPEEVNPDDYLVLTVICSRTGLPPVKQSTRITPLAPVDFSYPADPKNPADVRINVIGVIGGTTLRSQELKIDSSEKSIFVLASKSGVQIVAKQAVLPENDALAHRLQEAGAKPVLTPGRPPSKTPVTESGSISISLEVELVPQPTDVSCWVAALAMVIGFRDRSSYAPEDIAAAAGMDVNTSYGWGEIRNAVNAWNLREEGPASAMPELWADLLRDYGPIWIVEVGAPYHAVVLAGIQGDGTPEGTRVTVFNPWPPKQGNIEYKSFLDFEAEFELGAGASAAIVHR